jgi:hypothetical protein
MLLFIEISKSIKLDLLFAFSIEVLTFNFVRVNQEMRRIKIDNVTYGVVFWFFILPLPVFILQTLVKVYFQLLIVLLNNI